MTIRLRDVGEADELLLLMWRNDPLTRAMSVSQRRVPRISHSRWFECRPRTMWIGFDDEQQPVGVFRGDRAVGLDTYEVAVTVAPAHRGRGWAAQLIASGTHRLVQDWAAAVCLATIRIENSASIRAFIRAGYQWDRSSRNRRFVYFRWVRP